MTPNDPTLNAVTGIVLFAWGLVATRFPKVRTVISNDLIPWMNFAIALLIKLAGPTPASAAPLGVVAVAPWVGGVWNFLSPALSAAWVTLVTSLFYDKLAKPLLPSVPSDSKQ